VAEGVHMIVEFGKKYLLCKNSVKWLFMNVQVCLIMQLLKAF